MDYWAIVRSILEKTPKIKSKELRSKFRKKTHLSESTTYYHFAKFIDEGKLMQEKGWYWLPEGVGKRKHTKFELKRLSLGLEAILAEDRTLWRPNELSERKAKLKEKIETEGNAVKECSVNHLRTGYPMVYRKLQRLWNLKTKIRERLKKEGYLNQEIEGILNYVTFIGKEVKISKRIEKLLALRAEVYLDLTSEIESIILEINMRGALKGSCKWCS